VINSFEHIKIMEKLPALTTRTKILIMQWFQMLLPGEVCTMEQIKDYVARHSNSKPSIKTIQNNVAQLKKGGYVNYTEKRFIQIVK